MAKLNKRLLPIKAHYFFFMAGKEYLEYWRKCSCSVHGSNEMPLFSLNSLITIFYFFLVYEAMGPILPQTNVFGKELGISPDVMGFITSFLPILYILAKPAVGYLIDSFPVAFPFFLQK